MGPNPFHVGQDKTSNRFGNVNRPLKDHHIHKWMEKIHHPQMVAANGIGFTVKTPDEL